MMPAHSPRSQLNQKLRFAILLGLEERTRLSYLRDIRSELFSFVVSAVRAAKTRGNCGCLSVENGMVHIRNIAHA
jgi:hypothetical protein